MAWPKKRKTPILKGQRAQQFDDEEESVHRIRHSFRDNVCMEAIIRENGGKYKFLFSAATAGCLPVLPDRYTISLR